MKTQNANELRPVSAQLQRAIRERVERVRENAVEVVLLDRIMESETHGGSGGCGNGFNRRG